MKIKGEMKTAKGTRLTQAKQRALMVIKKRKMYEGQYNQMCNQQFNIDSMAFGMESIQ